MNALRLTKRPEHLVFTAAAILLAANIIAIWILCRSLHRNEAMAAHARESAMDAQVSFTHAKEAETEALASASVAQQQAQLARQRSLEASSFSQQAGESAARAKRDAELTSDAANRMRGDQTK
jgi:hypothetical protein